MRTSRCEVMKGVWAKKDVDIWNIKSKPTNMYFLEYNKWWWQAQQKRATMCVTTTTPKAKTKPSSEEKSKVLPMKAMNWKHLMLVDGKIATSKVTNFQINNWNNGNRNGVSIKQMFAKEDGQFKTKSSTRTDSGIAICWTIKHYHSGGIGMGSYNKDITQGIQVM